MIRREWLGIIGKPETQELWCADRRSRHLRDCDANPDKRDRGELHVRQDPIVGKIFGRIAVPDFEYVTRQSQMSDGVTASARSRGGPPPKPHDHLVIGAFAAIDLGNQARYVMPP